jgi:hypothetical protein
MRKFVAALLAAFIVFGVSAAPAEAKPPIKVCIKHHWPLSKCRDQIVIILPPAPIPYPGN